MIVLPDLIPYQVELRRHVHTIQVIFNDYLVLNDHTKWHIFYNRIIKIFSSPLSVSAAAKPEADAIFEEPIRFILIKQPSLQDEDL